MAKSASTLFKEQTARDIAHHEWRIEWLSRDAPEYICGTPVAKHDALLWLNQSRRIIENPCLGYGSGGK